jgi:hypothetical protein
MRHFICAGTVPITPAAHALGVFVSTQTAALVALAGSALAALARVLGAAASAVALAPVTVAAHHHLFATAGA